MYEFTTKWFYNTAKDNWDNFIPQLLPQKILEIGSYEGMATCYLIEKLNKFFPIELWCIDTWEGGQEHKNSDIDMESVEKRFFHNIEYAKTKSIHMPTIIPLKGYSEDKLIELYVQGKKDYFDFIYVDEEKFDKYKFSSFEELKKNFREYKD